jgi:3-methyladenine DNA glycosylase/8-oxoguanine DNA glycosylase
MEVRNDPDSGPGRRLVTLGLKGHQVEFDMDNRQRDDVAIALSPQLTGPDPALAAATAQVARVDPAYGPVIEAVGPFTPRPAAYDSFNALAASIVFQQLAPRAARTIHRRFLALYGGQPTASAILRTPTDALRAVGLSASKAAAIADLAAKTSDGTVPLDRIAELPDAEIVERLVAVRGIGRWTAEMFLIFKLRRLDVWPVGDFAVRKGFAIIHGLPESPPPKAFGALGEIYRPYRTVAAWYCWRATDTALPGDPSRSGA